MALATFILLLVLLINLSLLIFILTHKNRPRRWPIFTMVALLFIWQASELANIFIFLHTPYLMTAVRFGLLPTLYLAPTWVWLVLSLFDRWSIQNQIKKWLWFVPAIIMSPLVFTSLNVESVIIGKGVVSYIPGDLYLFFAIYFGVLMSYGLYCLIRYRRQAMTIVRRQIDYIFVATALTAIVALLLNVLLPLLGFRELYYTGVNASVLFTSMVTYALYQYRFYDLKMTSYKVVADLLRLLITGLLFYLLFRLLVGVVLIDFSQTTNLVVWLLLLGLLAPLVFEWVSRGVDYLINNPSLVYDKALADIAQILRSNRDFNFLLAGLAKEISQVIDYNDLYLYLSKRSQPRVFYQVFPNGERLLDLNISQWLQILAKNKTQLNTAELVYWQKENKVSQELKEAQVDIALPIFYNQQLLGVLLIDNRGKLLSVQQLEFLEAVNKYLDIAIGGLLLYQQAMADKK